MARFLRPTSLHLCAQMWTASQLLARLTGWCRPANSLLKKLDALFRQDKRVLLPPPALTFHGARCWSRCQLACPVQLETAPMRHREDNVTGSIPDRLLSSSCERHMHLPVQHRLT